MTAKDADQIADAVAALVKAALKPMDARVTALEQRIRRLEADPKSSRAQNT